MLIHCIHSLRIDSFTKYLARLCQQIYSFAINNNNKLRDAPHFH